MKKVTWDEASRNPPMPPIIDARALVRAEVLRRAMHVSPLFERVVHKVIAQLERDLETMDGSL